MRIRQILGEGEIRRLPSAVGFAVVVMLLGVIPASAIEYRTFTGAGNNVAHPAWGSADGALMRIAPLQYAD